MVRYSIVEEDIGNIRDLLIDEEKYRITLLTHISSVNDLQDNWIKAVNNFEKFWMSIQDYVDTYLNNNKHISPDILKYLNKLRKLSLVTNIGYKYRINPTSYNWDPELNKKNMNIIYKFLNKISPFDAVLCLPNNKDDKYDKFNVENSDICENNVTKIPHGVFFNKKIDTENDIENDIESSCIII